MRRLLAAVAAGLLLTVTLTACGEDDSVSDADRAKVSEAALAAVGDGSVSSVERGDEEDTFAYEAEVQLPSGEDVDVQLDDDFRVTNNPPKASDAAAATPSDGSSTDADDAPLTGFTLTKASAAAVKAAGGGRVVDSGRSDDPDHVYEVEVRLDGGRDVDVELDRDFQVTSIDR